ncbi:uncharacterized protein LOC110020873 [Phalaenopsis equestris]|uniref:uncharacterized protein LOC110020873 n=1 Tax=Phalaenopsis equestris TaxID=78828 RepID=UPI0009E55AD8|nr:uncharacterized protein LOC110020873 [Phalaenopsis equestris]
MITCSRLENGCAGVFVMAVSSPSPKIYWRVDGTKGTLQIERGVENEKHGYTVLFYAADGLCRRAFHPFSGVNEELNAFVRDIKQATNKQETTRYEAEPRSSYLEGARDIAVLEAMLESSSQNGANITVKSL